MTTKPSGQFSFVEALLPQGLGRSGRLDRLSSLVKWYRFEKILARHRSPVGPGRPAYSSLVMFKALLLQSLYGCRTASWRRRSPIGCRSAASSA
jgi:IS5 family transposase